MHGPTAPPSPLAIFNEALEQESPADRTAYLDRACAGDPALRARGEALLSVHDRAGEFLESPAMTPTLEAMLQEPAEGVGTAIGPYKLMEQIGEGGMGVVYVAEQHQPVRRKVALKIIKPGMDTKQVVARFEAERKALALMDHPNIARVIDAGATDSGRPYFVMELVRGIPITEYCDRERLSIPERLELFVLVCRAVQHAHQKGIIHRDLKPSNILVTVIDGAAVPKVIDFGVAKATGAALTERTLYTAFQQFIGTPLYMSPEQADLAGVDVDTRSDIYSLGVLLYELLTGTTPFDQETFRTAAFDEMRRILREQEPPRPSTRLSTLGAAATTVSANRKADARQLDRTIRGELDWVVMKALEKDRRRRYETAGDVAADVMRYLTDQPVQAHPPSVRYRFLKFGRRYRAGLTTAFLVALALLAGTTISLWQAVRARQAAADAQERAGELKQVVEYLTKDVFITTGRVKAGPRSVTVGELLDRTETTIGERFRRRPLAEAAVRMALAESFFQQLQFERAERNAARAVELRQRFQGPEHPYTLEALVLRSLPLSRMRTEGAEACRRIHAVTLRVLGPNHPDTLLAQSRLAYALGGLGRHGEAEELAAQANERAVRFLGPEHDTTLNAQQTLGLIAQWEEDLPRAEALLRHNLEGWERVHGAMNDGAIVSLNHLAQVVLAQSVRMQGRTEEARWLLMEAVNRFAQVYGLPHVRTSSAIYRLLGLLREQRDYLAIRDLCQGWIRELLAWPPGLDLYERQRHSLRFSQLAVYLAALPEEVPLDGELAVSAAARGAEQGNDAEDNSWTRLSLVHLRLGHFERAEWALRESMKRHKGDCFDSMTWALIHARRGELAEARKWFDRAERQNGRHGSPGHGFKWVRELVARSLGESSQPAEVRAWP